MLPTQREGHDVPGAREDQGNGCKAEDQDIKFKNQEKMLQEKNKYIGGNNMMLKRAMTSI
jgi:hypothetical protein